MVFSARIRRSNLMFAPAILDLLDPCTRGAADVLAIGPFVVHAEEVQ
jgi:hypothetical protein